MQQTVICPKCGSQNDSSYQFCLSCGNALQASCPNCASPVDPNDRYCSTCGAGLGWAMKIRDIQYQISQIESNINLSINQNYSGLQHRMGKLEDDFNFHENMLNNAADNIYKLLATERQMNIARGLNKTGLGLMALGLAIIGLSYVLTDILFLPLIGIGVAAAGFIFQLISGFMSG
jgi:NMD protein affecting ribosome stability and mRNA decay